jgi:hypothetical protein
MQNYPLILNYNLWSVPHTMRVTDAQGHTCIQMGRSLTLKQQIEVTTYQNHQQQVYTIAAEKLLTLKPIYDIWNPQGQTIGTIQRRNLKFWWDAQYNVWDGKKLILQLQEESNPRWLTALLLVTVMAFGLAGCASQIPMLRLLGLLLTFVSIMGLSAFSTGHFLNPLYSVKRPDGKRVMQFAKIPEFNLHNSRFSIKSIDQVSETEEYSALCAIVLMIMNERSRN